MGSTLSVIQDEARLWASDSELDLTSGDYLTVTNLVYLGMCTPGFRIPIGSGFIHIGKRYPELTVYDTSLTTVAGTATYTWPTSTVFNQESVEVEVLLSGQMNMPRKVLRAMTMDEWRRFWSPSNGYPDRWRLYSVSGTVMLEFTPKPYITGDTIRITGITQPTAFTGASSTSIFLNSMCDKALAVLIAAYVRNSRGEVDRAQVLVSQARGMLPEWDMTPALNTIGQSVPFLT